MVLQMKQGEPAPGALLLTRVHAFGSPADDILAMPSHDPEADSQKNGIRNINDAFGKVYVCM